jgi:hypothetical protein
MIMLRPISAGTSSLSPRTARNSPEREREREKQQPRIRRRERQTAPLALPMIRNSRNLILEVSRMCCHSIKNVSSLPPRTARNSSRESVAETDRTAPLAQPTTTRPRPVTKCTAWLAYLSPSLSISLPLSLISRFVRSPRAGCVFAVVSQFEILSPRAAFHYPRLSSSFIPCPRASQTSTSSH